MGTFVITWNLSFRGYFWEMTSFLYLHTYCFNNNRTILSLVKIHKDVGRRPMQMFSRGMKNKLRIKHPEHLFYGCTNLNQTSRAPELGN